VSSLLQVKMNSLQVIEVIEQIIPSLGSLELGSKDESLAFGYLDKGTISIKVAEWRGSGSGNVNAGESILLPAGRSTAVNLEPQPAHVILVRFLDHEHSFMEALIQSAGSGLTGKLHQHRIPQLRMWMQELLKEGRRGGISAMYMMQSYVYMIAAQFIEASSASEPEGGLFGYVVRVKQSMLLHYQEPMDMEELARQSGASPARFYQAFKKYTGLSPLKYMTIVRLNQSLRLLSDPGLTVMEVAHAVGYPDELYFSRLFKKHMGISPTEFAAAAKRRMGCLSPVLAGDLAALGVTPLFTLQRGWSEDGKLEEQLQRIQQAAPELLFTSDISDEVHERLAEMAPVAKIQWKGPPWKERLKEISRYIGVPTVADRWLAYFESRVHNARNLVRSALNEEPYLVVSVYPSFYRVYGLQRRKIQDLFYGDLKVTAPDAVREISFLDTGDLEEIRSLDCAHALFLVSAAMDAEKLSLLQQEWLSPCRPGEQRKCIVLQHEEPLLYNATFYDQLVDQFVDHLITT
jgi:AraC family transcriptional regulator, transcriptional activator for feuABC-ybbA operon